MCAERAWGLTDTIAGMTPEQAILRVIHCLDRAHESGFKAKAFVRALDVRPFILLAPSRIARELLERPGYYMGATLVTGRHALIGLVIALIVAILVGAALAASRFLEHAVQPVLMLVLVAPWVAYFTSIVVWLGRGDAPVIFLVALAVAAVAVAAMVFSSAVPIDPPICCMVFTTALATPASS